MNVGSIKVYCILTIYYILQYIPYRETCTSLLYKDSSG